LGGGNTTTTELKRKQKCLKYDSYKCSFQSVQRSRRICVISGFHRDLNENCALLGYCTASSSNFLPTFREKTSEDVTDRLFRNVGKNYHYSLRNNSEERGSREKDLSFRSYWNGK
jgi:hypothetical protein